MLSTFFQVAVTAAAISTGMPADTVLPVGPGPRAGTPVRDVVRYDGSAAEVDVATPSVTSAAIDVDGRLDEPVWEQAALLEGFTQYDPIEGSPASQRTEVYVLVDEDAVYFGVKAYDDNPAEIRATLSERDSYTFTDDYVRFVLDTFNDQRRAYVFTVNPRGVQHDGLWNESGGGTGQRGRRFGSPIDDAPDFLWWSDAHLTDWGYQAEVRIPFKSLRFPELEEQSWGLQVERNIQRNGYKSSWAPITGNVANKLTQTGRLNELRNLDMGLFMELNPVVTGSRNGEINELGAFEHQSPEGEFGFNAMYGITSNLTLDATYNPDFSQVEADAGQVQVNERFALFFPEQRPFFLEGTEIFGMQKQLVYTRTIENPIAGGKLTGKVGGLNLGYLGAIDETFSEDAANVFVNLVRVRGDVGGSSTVGAVYTDRTRSATKFNRVAGADARLQFGGRYTLSVIGAQSFTSEDDFESRQDGGMFSTRIERAGRNFSFNADLEDTQANFDPGSGFFQRIGTAQVNSQVNYTWFGGRGALLEQVSPSLQARGYWQHDRFWDGEGLYEGEVQVSSRFGFKNNITMWGSLQYSMFEYLPEQYEGLFVLYPDGSREAFRPDQSLFSGLPSITTGLWVNRWERIRGNVRLTFSETPIFDRRYGVAVDMADSFSGDASLNLYPMPSLKMEFGTRWTRLVRQRDGVEHSDAIIPRLRTQYQFSRALFLRGIFEYGTQTTAGLTDPETGLPLYDCGSDSCSARSGGEGHDFRVEGLLGYEPSPGTVFYFGYTRQMQDASAFGFEDIQARRDGLFLKLSYRFRL
jgi:hypothetical protein